jgi:hypothetical protein
LGDRRDAAWRTRVSVRFYHVSGTLMSMHSRLCGDYAFPSRVVDSYDWRSSFKAAYPEGGFTQIVPLNESFPVKVNVLIL